MITWKEIKAAVESVPFFPVSDDTKLSYIIIYDHHVGFGAAVTGGGVMEHVIVGQNTQQSMSPVIVVGQGSIQLAKSRETDSQA